MFKMNIQHRCMVMLSSRITHLERYQYIILYNNTIFQFMLRLWIFFFHSKDLKRFKQCARHTYSYFHRQGQDSPKVLGILPFLEQDLHSTSHLFFFY